MFRRIRQRLRLTTWRRCAIAAAATSAVVLTATLPVKALFNNGGFEDGNLGGWTTDVHIRDLMDPATPPFTRANVRLHAGGVDATEVVGNGTGRFAFTDPATTGGTGPTLQYPRYGNYAARVNKASAGAQNANVFRQTSTVASTDVDPIDGKVHVAFAFAAVAVDGGHQPEEQPFFFVTVYNKTRGNSIVFQRYAYANMPGMTWYDGAASTKYTDWNIVDIAPGNGVLAVGDEIELEIIAAGCEPGAVAHQSWIYVDAFGSRLPGLAITATAPQYVNAGSNLTYTLAYRNGVEDEFTGTVAEFELPAGTTFVSVSDPLACTFDVPNNKVVCNLGAMARNGAGTFEVVVNVPGGAPPTITSGDYSIAAAGEPAVYGQAVNTQVVTDTLVDLKADIVGSTPVVYGNTVTYTATISNPAGPNNPANSGVTGANVMTTLPNGLNGATWTCVGAGGATCSASGGGDVNDVVNIPVNGTLTYTITGTLNGPIAGGSSVSAQVQVSVPSGYQDNDPTNNADLDVQTVNATPVDVSVVVAGPDNAPPNGPATYTVTVTNHSGNTLPGFTLTTPGGLPATLIGGAWSCVATNGSICSTPAGTTLNESITLGPNGTLTYTLVSTVAPSATFGDTFTLNANVALPPVSGYTDSNPANNTSSKQTTVGGLTVTGVGPSGGRAEGGTLITITGHGFEGFGGATPTVLIGGQPATFVQVLDDGTIVARVPALPPGTPLDVVVSYGGGSGEQGTLPLSYTPFATPASQTTDTDNDGVPDWWELQFGTDPLVDDSDLDPDGDGRLNGAEYTAGTHPRGFYTRYFAEGANSWFFDTTMAIGNPGGQPMAVMFRYLREDGVIGRQILTLDGQRSRTLKPADVEGGGFQKANFSTVVESDLEFVSERTMTWLPEERYGSHAEAGIKAPAPVWYLAEGATFGGFHVYYMFQNPNPNPVTVEVTYLLPAPQAPVVKSYEVIGNSRYTVQVNVEDERLAATDVSAIVRTKNGEGIVVERAMYLSGKELAYNVGHAAAGVTAPRTSWYFAEGATGTFFDMFVLLANPGAQKATVTLRFLRDGGAPVELVREVDPNSRLTVNPEVEHPDLAQGSMAVQITSDEPILAERSMYWPSSDQGGWNEGHVSTGAEETGTVWATANGELGGTSNADTFLLVANTAAAAGRLRITLLLEDGAPVSIERDIQGFERLSVGVGGTPEFAAAAKDKRFAILVESIGATPVPVIVERSTYTSDVWGNPWAAGTAAQGTKLQ